MRKSVRMTFLIGIPCAGILFLLIGESVLRLIDVLPTCRFLESTGYLCPGCGNTRGFIALSHLDIVSSVKFNITPLVLVIFLGLWYVELLLPVLGKTNVKVVPRNRYFYIVFGIAMGAYLILRNVI